MVFELLRLLRREFSLMSRPEALQYREACLKVHCEEVREASSYGCTERGLGLRSRDFTLCWKLH